MSESNLGKDNFPDMDPTTGDFKDVAEMPSRVTKRLESLLKRRQDDPEGYKYVLDQIKAVATLSINRESDVAEIYREAGWTWEDFRQLFAELGEDVEELENARQANITELENMSFEQKLDLTLPMLVNFNQNPDDYPLSLDEIASAMAKSKALHETVSEYLSPGGRGYDMDPDMASSRLQHLDDLLIEQLRARDN